MSNLVPKLSMLFDNMSNVSKFKPSLKATQLVG